MTSEDDVWGLIREAVRGEADGTSIRIPVEHLRLLLDARSAVSTPPTITDDQAVERGAIALDPIPFEVRNPGPVTLAAQEHAREKVRAILSAVSTPPTITEAQARIDELVAWIDHTLSLPVFNPPTTDLAKSTVTDYKSWRRLLLEGLHPDARAALHPGGETNG